MPDEDTPEKIVADFAELVDGDRALRPVADYDAAHQAVLLRVFAAYRRLRSDDRMNWTPAERLIAKITESARADLTAWRREQLAAGACPRCFGKGYVHRGVDDPTRHPCERCSGQPPTHA